MSNRRMLLTTFLLLVMAVIGIPNTAAAQVSSPEETCRRIWGYSFQNASEYASCVRRFRALEDSFRSTSPQDFSPLTLPRYEPARPTESDLRVTLGSLDTLGDSTAIVDGRVCNRATGYRATSIRIEFSFYDRSDLPTGDADTYRVIGDVDSGSCKSFSAWLTAWSRWQSVGVDRVRWTWERE